MTIRSPVAGADQPLLAHAVALVVAVHDPNIAIATARRIVAEAGGTIERAETPGTFVAEVPAKRYDAVLQAFKMMGRVVRRDDESAEMRTTLAADERTIRDIMSETAKQRWHTPHPIDLGGKAFYHAMLSRDLTLRAIQNGRITLTLIRKVHRPTGT